MLDYLRGLPKTPSDGFWSKFRRTASNLLDGLPVLRDRRVTQYSDKIIGKKVQYLIGGAIFNNYLPTALLMRSSVQ
jgi:hypothetical protein